jgi:hypothetical protein
MPKNASKNSKTPSPPSTNGYADWRPLPKARTTSEQEHYERVTARNLFLQTRQGPVPEAIYGGKT